MNKLRLFLVLTGVFIISYPPVIGMEISNPGFLRLSGGQDSIPKGVITVEYFQDNEYYVFHRADGSIVKKVRYDSFPDYSPYTNLNFDWDQVGYGSKSNIGNKTFQEKKQRFNTINLDIGDGILTSCYEIRKFRPHILKPCEEFDSMNYVLGISCTFLDLANEYIVRFDNLDRRCCMNG